MDTISIQHIEKTPAVCGGDPVISGHHLRVMDVVVWHEMQGYSAEEVAGMFAITLAEVHSALAYYFDHREEIEAEIRRDEKVLKRILARHSSLGRKKSHE
jgi:uncharacterized protein (DUF433 family)